MKISKNLRGKQKIKEIQNRLKNAINKKAKKEEGGKD